MVEIILEIPTGGRVHHRVKNEEPKLTRRRHGGTEAVAAVGQPCKAAILCREPPAAAREGEEACDWLGQLKEVPTSSREARW